MILGFFEYHTEHKIIWKYPMENQIQEIFHWVKHPQDAQFTQEDPLPSYFFRRSEVNSHLLNLLQYKRAAAKHFFMFISSFETLQVSSIVIYVYFILFIRKGEIFVNCHQIYESTFYFVEGMKIESVMIVIEKIVIVGFSTR